MTSPGRRRAGIDVGGTKCLGVVVDASGGVVQEERRSTPRQPDELIEVLATMALNFGEVDSIGVGVPGLITREGVIRASPNLFDVRDLPGLSHADPERDQHPDPQAEEGEHDVQRHVRGDRRMEVGRCRWSFRRGGGHSRHGDRWWHRGRWSRGARSERFRR